MHPTPLMYKEGDKVKVLRRRFDNNAEPFDEVEAVITEDVEMGETRFFVSCDEYEEVGEIVVGPEDISKPDYVPAEDPAQFTLGL